MELTPFYRQKYKKNVSMKIAVYIYPDDLRLFDEITHLYHMRRSVLIREAMRQFVEREYEIAIKLKTS